MERYIYTDLACEFVKNNSNLYSIKTNNISESIQKNFYIDKNSNESCITYFTHGLCDLSNTDFLILQKDISTELVKLFVRNSGDSFYGDDFTVLAIGLGNPFLTPDSLGCETVKRIFVTNHLSREERKRYKRKRIAALIPDVTGNTGIETANIVSATALCVDPNVILVIDSLAARGYDRLTSVLQISDIGLTPGSGVYNDKKRLDFDHIGIPVITIGIPTVINSATMLADIVLKKKLSEDIAALDDHLNFFVTPKDIDVIIKDASILLAGAIDLAITEE